MMDKEHIRYIKLYDATCRLKLALKDYIDFHKRPPTTPKRKEKG